MNIKPIGNRVVLRPVKKEEKTSSGIILPDSAQDKPKTAEVIAVGNGGQTPTGTDYVMSVEVGDTVVYGNSYKTEISIEGEDVLIMSETEILAVLGDK
jgi:chaperonin GroES